MGLVISQMEMRCQDMRDSVATGVQILCPFDAWLLILGRLFVKYLVIMRPSQTPSS